jgi:hypothetical protein
MSLSTPVTLIIFNRPDLAEIVFEAIRQAQPKQLFVIADGPRSIEESEKCARARATIDRVDWDCQVLTNFSDTNLGSKYRISSGLDWVFSQVEEAIILEDDCLPSPSFFYFCQELLEKYRDDDRITHIGGTNIQFGQSRTPYSYYFSKYAQIWGWASWRRAWQNYDVEIANWKEVKSSEIIKSVHPNPYEQRYWFDILERVYKKSLNTCWDYQWNYHCWSQNGLSIIPEVNLISNIGFRADATHTTYIESNLAAIPVDNIWEIKHPPSIVGHQEADAYTFDRSLGGDAMKKADSVVGKSLGYLSKLKRKLINLVMNRLDFSRSI